MPRIVRVAGPAVLIAAALVAVVLSLAFGGGATAPAIVDPGPIVRWGLPITKTLVNLAVGLTLGSLLLALIALSPKEREYARALDVAAAAGAAWTITSAACAFFTFQSVYVQPVAFDDSYGQAFGQFLTQIAAGQAWLVMMLAGAVITVLCFAVRHQLLILVTFVIGVAALARLSNEGHSGDSSTHDIAATAIWLHMGLAAIWLGGLLTLVLLKGTLDRGRLVVVLQRYSTLALIAFIVVAASGYVSAAIRVGNLPNLLTPYGVLVLVKVAALLALGLFGAVQRRVLIRGIGRSEGNGRFWILVVAEIAFMGIASGVAAALARTQTPLADTGTSQLANPTPAELLTDKPLPPELTPLRWITTWNLDLMWALIVAFGIFFYLAGVWRLRRRGDRWPIHRSVLWIAGMLLLLWSTNGMPNVYEQFLFSAHMTVHMVLSMMIPVFLVLSAPVTLAMRAIHKRSDGSRGPREWILWAVHSKYATFLSHPIIASVLFAGSLWVFYYSPLFRWATTDHLGHMWMTVHFLIVGYLFVQMLVGIDPLPYRPPYPLRLLLLLATMAMHAFFGLSIIESSGLFLADWYGAMGRTWGDPPLVDQQAAGGIAWSVGELPTVSLAILVALMWSRSDAREAKRRDRKADRDGEADLEQYNRMLAERGARD
ncbi:cytochrome c oxidase assembly protein [Schumannella luteola]|uniref:Putative copper resistance protein D n=1 Tax=Schumannella luteola TaxID=472059 RepID=A0A852Y8C6_9MICO|nr:putative copper resistance protein D [Schumannella luteola]